MEMVGEVRGYGAGLPQRANGRMLAEAPTLADLLSRMYFELEEHLIGRDVDEDRQRDLLDWAEAALHRSGHWSVWPQITPPSEPERGAESG